MWDDDFERLLRERLPFLPPDQDLEPGLDLRANGLDSMGVVDLMVTLERRYGVRFTDEALTLQTFATPGVLWQTLSSLSASAA